MAFPNPPRDDPMSPDPDPRFFVRYCYECGDELEKDEEGCDIECDCEEGDLNE